MDRQIRSEPREGPQLRGYEGEADRREDEPTERRSGHGHSQEEDRPEDEQIGTLLLTDTSALSGVWVLLYNTPVIALGNPTNSIVVGSFVGWMVSWLPIFFVMRWAVARYRSTIYERYKDAKVFRAMRASKIYNLYRLFRPSVG